MSTVIPVSRINAQPGGQVDALNARVESHLDVGAILDLHTVYVTGNQQR